MPLIGGKIERAHEIQHLFQISLAKEIKSNWTVNLRKNASQIRSERRLYFLPGIFGRDLGPNSLLNCALFNRRIQIRPSGAACISTQVYTYKVSPFLRDFLIHIPMVGNAR